MKYTKGIPRGNIGASTWNVDENIAAGQGIFSTPPDRVSMVTVSVHIPEGHARFTIETTYSGPWNIGQDGLGGYWDPPDETHTEYTENTNVTIASTVTGVRVTCLEADKIINVCFAG